jgi:hypothetical protein
MANTSSFGPVSFGTWTQTQAVVPVEAGFVEPGPIGRAELARYRVANAPWSQTHPQSQAEAAPRQFAKLATRTLLSSKPGSEEGASKPRAHVTPARRPHSQTETAARHTPRVCVRPSGPYAATHGWLACGLPACAGPVLLLGRRVRAHPRCSRPGCGWSLRRRRHRTAAVNRASGGKSQRDGREEGGASRRRASV